MITFSLHNVFNGFALDNAISVPLHLLALWYLVSIAVELVNVDTNEHTCAINTFA